MLERTDGWAAGLRLSLSTRHARASQRPGSRTQRHLFDYLAAEVLDDMPADLREFVLRCSVLPEWTAARCAQVSGMPHAARLLDEVERRGLFVSLLDADEPTLRLHDLFRDFLEDRLLRDQAGELPALLRRAAEHEGDIQRKLAYLARAGAWAEATQVLAQRAHEQLSIGAGPALERMLELFPEKEFESRPDLQLVRGLAAWPRFDWDLLRRSVEAAAQGYAREGRTRDAALATVCLCSGLHHAGRLEDATHELARLRELPLDDAARSFVLYTSAWDAFAGARGAEAAPVYRAMLEALERLPVAALWHQFPMHWVFIGLPGMRGLLARFAEGALRIAGDAPSPVHADAMHLRCWLALCEGRLDDAWSWLARADDDCRWLGMPRHATTANRMTHALMHALRGEADASHAAARELVDDIEQHSPLAHRRVHANEVLSIHCRASWILHDEPAVRSMNDALERAANDCEWRAAPLNRQLSLVRRAARRAAERCPATARAPRGRHQPQPVFPGRPGAHHAGRRAAPAGPRRGRRGDTVPLARHGARRRRDRRRTVRGARGDPPSARIDWGARLGADGAGALQRLSTWLQPAGESAPSRVAAPDAQAAAHGWTRLSEREREVLERIAAGDSNKLIARAFDLSPHTVKRHVANILDKLALASRGQAAAWYREQR